MLMAAGLALSVSAVACGDDDDGDDDTAGTGGHNGGSGGAKGGTGGSSGSKGGSGGSGGNGGGGVTPATCSADTKTATMGSFPDACYSCLCGAAADITATTACNKQAMCWPLISCIGDKCAGMDTATCAVGMCGEFVAGGGTPAMPVGALLQGKCSAQCLGGDDAGMPDAGN